jgi:rhodanese-related sulfurtransferase
MDVVCKYSGDVLSPECWQVLSQEANSYLIDVRTNIEWQTIGIANLQSIDKETKLISIKLLPNMSYNNDFIPELLKIAPDKAAKLFFICKSGGRSKEAALLASQYGYKHCYNVLYGFEGELSQDAFGNTVGGWKALNLPWRQC